MSLRKCLISGAVWPTAAKRHGKPGVFPVGTLESLRTEGVQIVILDSPDIYSEYAPYEYIEDMKLFIDKVCTLNRAA